MGFRLLLASGIIVAGAVLAIFMGQAYENSSSKRMAETLLDSASRPVNGAVDFADLSELPPPVVRYLRHVLTEGQKLIKVAKITQSGVLRTSTTADTWSAFMASQLVVPPAVGFLWNARVDMPLGAHVRVLDSYIDGEGSGRVSLMSAFTVASETDVPELNSGALHRYLAEAVWYPTALLPQSGVVWSPIDDHAAIATLVDGNTGISLEFRFNEVGEIKGICSSGRFSRSDDGYKLIPWEGHFRNYQVQQGMRIPLYGEVGWYENGELQLVWKGNVTDTQYEFVP